MICGKKWLHLANTIVTKWVDMRNGRKGREESERAWHGEERPRLNGVLHSALILACCGDELC